MLREVRRRTIQYANHSVEIDQPAWWCGSCGEGLLDANDAAVADVEFARIKTAADKGDGAGA
jgi:HTH-type transcriptional regulator/antitoxin MqsA